MENDVCQMEQRLQMLKTTMSAERGRRDLARKSNPTGSAWKSSRTDVPISSQRYVEQVLAKPSRQAPPPQPLLGSATAPSAQQFAVGNPLLGGQPAAVPFAQTRTSFCGTIVQEENAAVDGGVGTETAQPEAAAYAWNPLAAVAGSDDSAFEDLIGPDLVPLEAPVEAERSPEGRPRQNRFKIQNGGQHAQAVSPTAASSSSLLEGDYDESQSAASFQQALRQWRGESGPGESEPQPVPAARSSAPPAGAPSLTACVEALSAALEIPPRLPLMEAVARANECVGLEPHGSLSDQVQKLLQTTGVKVAPPARRAQSRASTPRGPMATQTAKPNYYQLLMDQKRRDGVL